MTSNELYLFMEELTELFGSAEGAFLGLGELFSGGALAISGIISLIGVAGAIIAAIFGFLMSVVVYVLRGIAFYAMGKKLNCKLAWLVWIPVCQGLLCIFVLYKMSGKEAFEFYHGKLKIQQGNLVILGYVLVHFFGAAIITMLIGILSFIPVIGQVLTALSPVLYLVPAAAKAIVEYVYLRDVIDLFKPDAKKNQTHSFIVTILDTLLTLGWARSVYLITMMKMQPLEKAPVECIVPEAEPEVVVEEPVSAE